MLIASAFGFILNPNHLQPVLVLFRWNIEKKKRNIFANKQMKRSRRGYTLGWNSMKIENWNFFFHNETMYMTFTEKKSVFLCKPFGVLSNTVNRFSIVEKIPVSNFYRFAANKWICRIEKWTQKIDMRFEMQQGIVNDPQVFFLENNKKINFCYVFQKSNHRNTECCRQILLFVFWIGLFCSRRIKLGNVKL